MEDYKISRYTTVHKTDYGLILFNTYSCGMIRINEGEAKSLYPINIEIVSSLAVKDHRYRKIFIENGFLVKKHIDEFALVKSNLYRIKYGVMSAGITINTGLACNCRCTYCYEGQEHSYNSMLSHEKANDIIAFIKKEFPPTTMLKLSFVGGEPLICFSHIKNIYYELKSIYNNVSLEITTNGLLITEDIAKFMKENLKYGVQISIDGLKHHHDKKRIDEKGGGTYDKIIENVKILQDVGVGVIIRTHIDQEFMDNVNLHEWIEVIKTEFD